MARSEGWQAKPLPLLDGTGKTHGDLPLAEDLDNFEVEDLEQFRAELQESVQKRIELNSKMGPKGNHGSRQGAEQDLIKSIDKKLENR